MSYLTFHLLFIVPPLAVLLLAVPAARRRFGNRALWTLPAVAAIALVYTTPWDNYLVYRGVWFYGADRVLGTIGYVPVEEYMFFLLQPLLTGLWLYLLLSNRHATRPPSRPAAIRAAGGVAYLAVATAGVLLLRSESGTYMGLILAWAAPVLAGQWAYAGDTIVRHGRAAAIAIAVPTLYLWVADATAIRLGIWHIAERYTLGPAPFGLPIEEATFFLVTNILVVQGLLLFLYRGEAAT
jgi:lycopene beta-cyclase